MPDDRLDAASQAPRLLVTAGPTREPIDAVRYISNRSSGRMGLAIAAEATKRGWPTTILLGPGIEQPPHGSTATVRRFRTTSDLERELAAAWPDHDVLVMAAAVADYRPRRPCPDEKLRRGGDKLLLELEPTPDLLAGLADRTRADQVVIGFALEPIDRLVETARAKLVRKRVHAILANPLETMDSPDIDATLLLADGSVSRPGPPGVAISKNALAVWLLDRIESMRG